MGITIEGIMGLATMIITYVMGIGAKKFKWLESDYIPLQNFLIGIVAGTLTYLVGLSDNFITSVIVCMLSAFGAGGIYDFTKTKKEG